MPAVLSPYTISPDIDGRFASARASTTQFSIPDSPAQNMVVGCYAEVSVSTFSATGAASGTLLGVQGNSGTYGMVVGFAPAGSGVCTIDWAAASSAGCAYGVGIGDSTVVAYSSMTVLSFGFDNATWPSITPTEEGQVVLSFYGYSDNSGAPNGEVYLNAASYADATYSGHLGTTNLDGGDSAIGAHVFKNLPVGVPFAPQCNALTSNLGGTLTQVLISPGTFTTPRRVDASSGTFASTPVLPSTANWPGFPTKAAVEAIAKPGDLFFLFQTGYSGRSITVSNAAWLDGSYASGGKWLGWKRLDDGIFDAAWVSSPPLYGFNFSSGNSYFRWGLLRGVQRTGTYDANYQGAYTGPSFINYWNDVPITATADQVSIVVSEVSGDPGAQGWPTQPAYQQMLNDRGCHGLILPADQWTPGAPGTDVDLDWSFNRTPSAMNVAFLSVKPTWFIDGEDVSADATVVCTMTAEPGAKFIVTDDVVLDATVELVLTSVKRRRAAPRREYVWTYALDGTPTGVIV